jgi:uncharacterized protein
VTDQVTAAAPPGWYEDPWRQATWRWWDGATWTAQTDQAFSAAPPWAPATLGAPEAEAPVRAGGIALLGAVIGLVLGSLIAVILTLAGYTTDDPALLLGSTLGLWFGLGGSCVVAVRRKGSGSLRDLGLVRPRWVDAALGVGFAIALIIVVSIVAAALQAIDKNLLPGGRTDLAEPIDHGGVLGVIAVYVIAVVGAPFFEELFFRGLVQGTLTARWGTAIGIAVQALLFATVHLQVDNGWGNVGTFVLIAIVGTSLGLIRRYSGRLPPGMFTHAAYNAVIVSLMMVK